MKKLNTIPESPLQALEQAKRYRLSGKTQLALKKCAISLEYCKANLDEYETVLTPFYEEVELEIGLIFLQEGQLEEALDHLLIAYRRFRNLYVEFGDEYSFAFSYTSLALSDYYFGVGDYQESINLAQNAIKLLRDLFEIDFNNNNELLKKLSNPTDKQKTVILFIYLGGSYISGSTLLDPSLENNPNIVNILSSLRRSNKDNDLLKTFLLENDNTLMSKIDHTNSRAYDLDLFKYSKASKFDPNSLDSYEQPTLSEKKPAIYMKKLNTKPESFLEALKQAKRYRLSGQGELGLEKTVFPLVYCKRNLDKHEVALTPFYEELELEIGLNFLEGGLHQESLDHLFIAYRRYRSLYGNFPNEYAFAFAYTTLVLGACYYNMNDYHEAINYVLDAIKLFRDVLKLKSNNLNKFLNGLHNPTDKQNRIIQFYYLGTFYCQSCVFSNADVLNESNASNILLIYKELDILWKYLEDNNDTMVNRIKNGKGIVFGQAYDLNLFKYSKASKFDHNVIDLYNQSAFPEKKPDSLTKVESDSSQSSLNTKIKDIFSYIKQRFNS